MKNQALISSKDKSKKLKCRLLQFLFGALRVCGLRSPNIFKNISSLTLRMAKTLRSFGQSECNRVRVTNH